MTQRPDTVASQAGGERQPYVVPSATSLISPPPAVPVPVHEPVPVHVPVPVHGPVHAAAMLHGSPVPHESVPAAPRMREGHLGAVAHPDVPGTALDPRVAAFGATVVQDPPLARTLLRWGLPLGAGVLGLLLGVALSANGNRPTAPVSISGPGVTTTVTATQRQLATTTQTSTVTVIRRSTVARTTTAPPPAPVTVTETVTVQRTVTVGDAPVRPRRPRLLP